MVICVQNVSIGITTISDSILKVTGKAGDFEGIYGKIYNKYFFSKNEPRYFLEYYILEILTKIYFFKLKEIADL